MDYLENAVSCINVKCCYSLYQHGCDLGISITLWAKFHFLRGTYCYSVVDAD